MLSQKTMNQMRAAVAVALQPPQARTAASDRWALSWPQSNSRGWDSHSRDSVLLREGVKFHKCYRS